MKRDDPPPLVTAVAEITSCLAEQNIPYAIIGGLAVQYWGEPRATRDIDITVLVPTASLDAFLQQLISRFSPRVENAIAFARCSRMLLLQTESGIPIDISLGIPGYEEEVMKRAINVEWPTGDTVRIISCEDLIIHKCVAGRPRDLEDVSGILQRQGKKVDIEYIRRWLRVFAKLAPELDVIGRFEAVLASSLQTRSNLPPPG